MRNSGGARTEYSLVAYFLAILLVCMAISGISVYAQGNSLSNTKTNKRYATPAERAWSTGARGSEIKEVQKQLNRIGCRVATTGAGSPEQETNYFGEKTRGAVVCFQKRNGLEQTGRLDEETYTMLMQKKDALLSGGKMSTCEDAGGSWLPEYWECELQNSTAENTEEFCTETLRGEYNQCASACRHDEDSSFCVAVCVPLCSLSAYSEASRAKPVTLKHRVNTCQEAGGVWLPEHKECEIDNVDNKETFCAETLQGTYDECASACRHNEGERVCIASCTAVCTVETRAETTGGNMSREERKKALEEIREKIIFLREQIQNLWRGIGRSGR